MLVALLCVLVAANCVMLVKLTALMREFGASMLRCQAAVPDAAAVVRTDIARIDGKVERLLAGDVRMEAATAIVADDLAESHRRADETEGDDGAAADAAAKTGEA